MRVAVREWLLGWAASHSFASRVTRVRPRRLTCSRVRRLRPWGLSVAGTVPFRSGAAQTLASTAPAHIGSVPAHVRAPRLLHLPTTWSHSRAHVPHPKGERIAFQYLVTERFVDEEAEVEVVREGAAHKLRVGESRSGAATGVAASNGAGRRHFWAGDS